MMSSAYVQKARAIVNAKRKLLPQRTHWASVAGILSAWLEKKDFEIRINKRTALNKGKRNAHGNFSK